MRLASYSTVGDPAPRIGIVIRTSGAETLVDATQGYANHLRHVEAEPAAAELAAARIPADMARFLEGGERSLAAARIVERFAAAELAADAGRARLSAAGLSHDVGAVRLHPPVPRPGKIIMIGGNYHAHVGETNKAGNQLPSALAEKAATPPAFAKFPSVMVGHGDPLIYPRNSWQFDYEAELCVVIGKRCKDVPRERFAEVVAGYTIANDVSMRDLQFPEMRRGSTMLGKNLDTSMPVGPYLTTCDEIPDPQDLRLRCWVNGEERQNDTTANMVFTIADIIAYFSRMTLEPGDMISTGSPAGVGIFWKPPEHGLLRVGDVVEIEIGRLGRLRNQVVAEDETVATDPRRGARR
jgi:acylpyruvate hydrolase